jgi:hypothetical protein
VIAVGSDVVVGEGDVVAVIGDVDMVVVVFLVGGGGDVVVLGGDVVDVVTDVVISTSKYNGF